MEMSSDDKVFPKAFGSHTSSSALSTPEENGDVHDNAKIQSLQEFLKSYSRKELLCTSPNKDRKHSAPSNCIPTEELSKSPITKGCKNLELKRHSSNHSMPTNNQAFKKQPRKGDNPVRLPSVEDYADLRCTSTWICKNSACKAVLSAEDTFCKRCSCCICHLFDDNKDPSLWFVCASASGGGDWCGLSCHIECALQRGKAGVADHGQFMQLDGSYCCASCGKVSGIIGSWKRQLKTAKDARRVDVLCYRIFLSYRLLDGTSRFKELHNIINDAKAKLETEVGPVNGVSAKMARGIVSRLSVSGDVHRLCSLAIDKADEWLISNNSDPKHKEQNGAKGEANTPSARSSGFNLRNLGKVQQIVREQEEDGCHNELRKVQVDQESSGGSDAVKPETSEKYQADPSVARKLDLNVVSVPDLNVEITPTTDEENGCSSEKNGLARSNGSGDGESKKRSANAHDETCDGNSTLVNGSPLRFSNRLGQLDDSYEYCLKVIRWLECTGHIEQNFRMKFLTWFSLRSTDQERWVVITFIRTLADEPSSLAGQLLDSFSEIVTCKRPRSGFCTKLWH